MKLNSKIKLSGRRVVLVPYRRQHVDKYHKWMESSTLRQETASERLTLSEEYENQQSWLNDENKCTFIVLDKTIMDESEDEVLSMIGDANLYLKETDDGLTAEVGLMIADSQFRRRGLGFEAALSILRYGVEELKVNKFVAIISLSNTISISMFEKLKFIQAGVSEIFQEVTLERCAEDNWVDWLKTQTPTYVILPTETNY